MSHVITEKMPEIVGRTHWSRALDIHQQYLKSVKLKKKPRPNASYTNAAITSRTADPSTEFQLQYPLPPSPSASTAISLISLGDLDSKQGISTSLNPLAASTTLSKTLDNPMLHSPCTLSSFTDIQESFSLQPYSIYHHHYQINPKKEQDMEVVDDDSKHSSSYYIEEEEPFTSTTTATSSLVHDYNIYSTKSEYPSSFQTESTLRFQGTYSSSSSSSMDQLPPILRQTAETLLMVQKDVNNSRNIEERKGRSSFSPL